MRNFSSEFERIRDLPPRPRGLRFEQLFYDIFEDHGILEARSVKNEEGTQQIDGAVRISNKIFLVEIKWEKTNTLAARKLGEFIHKVNSKIDGTLGIFISYNELNERSVRSVRAGIKQNCIIIHGEDNILPMISAQVSIADYGAYIYTQASIRNKISVPISEYRKLAKKPVTHDRWKEVLEALLSKDDLNEFERKFDKYHAQIEDLPERVISIYPTLKNNKLQEKIDYLLVSIIDDENHKERLYDALISKLTTSHWVKYAHEDILDRFKNLFELDPSKAAKIADNVLLYLRQNDGLWEEDNKASIVLDFVYDYLHIKYNSKVACAYAAIYCDNSRKDKFPQKAFAKKIFSRIATKDRWKAITNEVVAQIEKYKSESLKSEERIFGGPFEYVERMITWRFKKIIDESMPRNLERQIKKWYDQV
jgi:hypothetical protein